ncbi:MAG: dihydrolipoyllysine-residue succinyltransferase [Verrucomicrobiales bacterium]|nr:dihydrolipoyllysine-residue succinyltransferase [Verrucomicrobiales bacterium]
MPQDIKIPNVGESISSGLLSQWHKADGDFVKSGDLLLTLETDKVSTELTAEKDGVLNISVPAGTEVEIGAVVGQILEGAAPPPTEAIPAATETPATATAPKSPADAPVAAAAASEPRSEPKPELTVTPKARATPVVVAESSARVTRRKMSPLRRKIAAHLVNAQHTAAILTTFNEVDMTGIMDLRRTLQDGFVARHGIKLGFMSFFIKAAVEALKAVPQVNGRIEGEEILENHYFDIGVAVGTEKGLVVPVLRDCDQRTFGELEKELAGCAARAKEGKIQLEELQGGVFTISNGGVYGSLLSTPILNPPQSAILGMHAIKERPVAVNGKVEIRPMMYLALSYDHRLIDGREAVTFLIRIKDCIEQPARLLVGA